MCAILFTSCCESSHLLKQKDTIKGILFILSVAAASNMIWRDVVMLGMYIMYATVGTTFLYKSSYVRFSRYRVGNTFPEMQKSAHLVYIDQ